jgi:hypothetical protein
MLAYAQRHRSHSPFIVWMLGYPRSLRSSESITVLADRVGMLTIVRIRR